MLPIACHDHARNSYYYFATYSIDEKPGRCFAVTLLSSRVITIAFAVHGWFIAIAFHNLQKLSWSPFHGLAELLRLLSKFAADYHGCFRKHMASLQSCLQYVESFTVAHCDLRNSSRSLFCEVAIHLNHSCEVAGKGRAWLSTFWWQRRIAPSLEGLLEGHPGGPWDRSLWGFFNA